MEIWYNRYKLYIKRGYNLPAPIFFHDERYKGMGRSAGLARGLQVLMEGVDLTQEGMGLGTIALRSQGYTYFSRDGQAVWLDSENMVQNYVIDTIHLAGRGDTASALITRVRELLSVLYRLLPTFQKVLLWAGMHIQGLLGVKSLFAPVSPRAGAEFYYKLESNRVEVRCEFHALNEPLQELYIMNELGADYFTSGWKAGRKNAPPSGWQVLDHHDLPFLYSPEHRLRFSLCDISVNHELPFKVCWGREKIDNLCWAGFSIQIDLAAASLADIICCYTVIFENEEN